MKIYKYFLTLVLLSNYVTGFTIITKPVSTNFIRNIHMSSSSENNRLKNIQNKINKYLQKDKPIEKGFSARIPIKKVPFDTIFLNIFCIEAIYITPAEDRIIVQLNNGCKYVFYSTNEEDKKKIRKIIEIVPNSITVKVITNNKVFDDNGFLYCENCENCEN